MTAYVAAVNAPSLSRGSSWDRSTKLRGSCGLAGWWLLREMSGSGRKSLTALPTELLQDVFGKDKNPGRLVYGVASLPLGVPVELELIFEVSA